jgi:PAS domain S-box-containing protein
MPDRGWVELLFSSSPLGDNTRSLLITALLVPFLLGWLISYGESAGFYSPGISRSSYAVAIMLFLAFIVVYNANRLRAAEGSKRLLQSDLFLVQRQLQAFVDNSPSAIFLKDLDGRYQLVNAHFERIVNRPRTQILGKTAQSLFSSEILRTALEGDRQVLETKDVVLTEIETTLEGDVRNYLSTKFPLLNREGNVESIGAIWTDITEQKALTESLNRKNLDLERSNKELEQFAYVASHDLQEPLRMVSSYMQLLESRYKDKLDTDAKEFIGYAVDGALRMQRLIQDLLAFSRVGTRGKTPLPVGANEAFDEAMLNLKLSIEETGAEVDVSQLPTVMADKDQLVQVFQNLLGNALKFRGENNPVIQVSAQKMGGFTEFTVQDNGIGFDPKHIDRIFVLFQRLNTRDKYEGTGIGLAICKKIVERHGGTIWAESQPGKGSTFHFTFPLAFNETEAEAAGEIKEKSVDTIEDRASRLI